MEYTYEVKDLLSLKYLLRKVYGIAPSVVSAPPSVIGYKGGISWANSDMCFMTSVNDIGYSHAITFWLNRDDDPRTMSYYQFMIEHMIPDIIKLDIEDALLKSNAKYIAKRHFGIVKAIIEDKDNRNVIKQVLTFFNASEHGQRKRAKPNLSILC